MISTPITTVASYVEPFLWASALVAFLRYKNRTTLSEFGIFLAIRTAGAFLLLGIGHASQFIPSVSASLQRSTYFDVYWATYLAGCIALFFVLQRIFLHIMTPFPKLSRLGLIAFRWAAVASLAVSIASVVAVFATTPARLQLAAIFAEIRCCFSVLVLCLLAFLAVSIYTLGQSFRSWISGVCLGFGVLAIMGLASSAFGISGFYAWPSQVPAIATIAALLIWIGYTLIPMREKKPASVSASLALLQWNDMAQELGPNTQPAMQQSGFLQNVESVVDRVLAKNSLGSTS